MLVVAPLYFAGQVQLGVITQSRSAFNHILNDLSLIINEFEALASFAASLRRLSKLLPGCALLGAPLRPSERRRRDRAPQPLRHASRPQRSQALRQRKRVLHAPERRTNRRPRLPPDPLRTRWQRRGDLGRGAIPGEPQRNQRLTDADRWWRADRPRLHRRLRGLGPSKRRAP